MCAKERAPPEKSRCGEQRGAARGQSGSTTEARSSAVSSSRGSFSSSASCSAGLGWSGALGLLQGCRV